MWERRNNLHGTVLTTSNLPYGPLLQVAEDKVIGSLKTTDLKTNVTHNGQVSVTGFFADLLLLLGDRLNFTFEGRIPRDGNLWGPLYQNGSYGGLVGELQ